MNVKKNQKIKSYKNLPRKGDNQKRKINEQENVSNEPELQSEIVKLLKEQVYEMKNELLTFQNEVKEIHTKQTKEREWLVNRKQKIEKINLDINKGLFYSFIFILL